MKKIWLLLAVLLIGLMVFNIPAVAQPSNTSTTAAAVIPSLAIKAPLVGYEGEKVLIKVVELPDGGPVAGAGVWAVDVNNSGNLAAVSSVEMDGIGIFLGWTDSNGEVGYIFGESGKYLLVAFKDGYLPGFNWIKIQPVKTLAIKGPATAIVNQPCEFTIYEVESGAVVPEAGVWALAAGDPAALTSTANNLASVIIEKGIFLGYTNNLGQVYHTFTQAGPYLLLAAKQGYSPAFSKIKITEIKELAIRAPQTVRVLQQVSIRVVEKSVLTVEIPVSGAAVWAISQTDKASLDNITDMKALVKSQGIFLGWTNNQGYVSPQPRFSNTGQYWLIAIKDGCVPGIKTITVVGLVPATPAPLINSVKSITNR